MTPDLPIAQQVAVRASARASGFAVALLCLLLVTRVSSVVALGQSGQVPFTVALLVLPLLYAIPAAQDVLIRYRWPVLAVQGVLTWVPFAVFGGSWQIGIGGLLAGLVLLMVPGRVSWLLAGALLVAELAVRVTLGGLPAPPAWYGVVVTVAYYADDALIYFGLVRLAQIVGDVERARGKSADLAITSERLRAVAALQAALGQRLTEVAAAAAEAQRDLSRNAKRARARIAAAGAAARDTVEQARAVTVQDSVQRQEPAVSSRAGVVIGGRLAWAVLVAVLSMFAIDGLATVIVFRYPLRLEVLAIADIVIVAMVQLYHSWAARRGGRARAWPLTLGVQALLVYAFALPFVAAYVGGLAPFLAGSVLLVGGRWRWAGYLAVAASWSVLYVTLPMRGAAGVLAHHGTANGLLNAATIAGTGLMVYGLSRLAGLAVQLEEINVGLARMAVVQERLRIARDVHDLLGLGLSAIALKADLIGRLIGRDDARAGAEIEAMSRICASALADARLVTGQMQRLSLAAELTAGRQILVSAGVEVRAVVIDGPLPAVADEVLAPVLREAMTNVLRHSSASVCIVEVTADDCRLRLRVRNDGVSGPSGGNGQAGRPAPGARQGRGLVNLTARMRDAGGQLVLDQAGGWFDLVAVIPLDGASG